MMKKLLFICFVIACFISSCKKDLVDNTVKETESQTTSSELVYWDDLPDEYKNAVRVSPERVGSEREVLPQENGRRDQAFNPFNLTSENFSITIPPYQIRKIAIGQGKYGAVSHITIWYHIGRQQSIVYVVSSGGSTSTPMTTYTPSTGEYIKGFSGRSENGVLKGLTIYTNRGSVSGGTSTTGTYFSFSATPGSFIGKFSGNVGSLVTQLTATSYFLPWQKVSANNAVDISIDANGTAYMADAGGIMYQMANTATLWSRITGVPSGVKRIAAHPEVLYVIADQGKVHKRINNQWTEMFGGNNRRDVAVNDRGDVYAIESNGNLRVFLTKAWNQVSFGVGLQSVSASGSGLSDTKVVSNGGSIYEPGGGSSSNLSSVSGPSDGRDIGMAATSQMWVTTTSGKIKFRNWPGSSWKEIAGSDAVRIDAIPGKLMIVNTVGEVYKLEF